MHGVGLGGEIGGQGAGDAAAEFGCLGGERGGVGGEFGFPFGLTGGTGRARIPGGADFIGTSKGGVCPAEGGAGCGYFGGTECGAVRLVGAGGVGCAEADDGLATDQGGFAAGGDGLGHGGFDALAVQAVDVRDDAPAVGLEALGCVVVEPALDVAVDGNSVVVVEDDQFLQPHGAGEGGGLVRNTLHQAAVAAEHEGAVIDDGMFAAVEREGELLFGHCHADGSCRP